MQKRIERGCLARSIEGLCGMFVAGSLVYLLVTATVQDEGLRKPIYSAAALLGGLLGVFLPEILDLLGRYKLGAEWFRLALGITTAATFSVMIGRLVDASPSGAALAVLLAILFWLVFEATTSGFVRLAPGSLASVIKSALRNLIVGVVLGVSLGFFAGLLRVTIGYSDITGNMWLFALFPAICMAAGVAMRLILLKLFEPGPISKKSRRIAIADGLVLGGFIGMITALPSNFGSIGSALPWIVAGPMVGLLCGAAVGGVRALFRFAVGSLTLDGSSLNESLQPLVKKIFGAAAIDPPRKPAPSPSGGTAQAGAGEGAAPPPRKSRPILASCCLGCFVFPAVLMLGLLMLGGKTVESNKDYDRLPKLYPGCPPKCAGADMPDFWLDCVPTVPEKCVDFSGADLTEVDLGNASLFSVKFKRANLRRARLNNASLMMADFTEADLSGADLRDAKLSNATMIGADLVDADLRSARLHGVDLTLARLDGANLQGAHYDSGTEWPRDFDPVAAGAQKEGF